MTETGRTSGTSVSFYRTTRRNIPRHNHNPTRCCENRKSHRELIYLLTSLLGANESDWPMDKERSSMLKINIYLIWVINVYVKQINKC